MSIKSTGTNCIQKAYSKYLVEFHKEARKTLIIHGNKMENEGRKNHRFIRDSGKADASIESIVSKNGVNLKFWINPRNVTTKKGYNYAMMQHEGTYSKYKPSGLGPLHPKKNAANGGGIRPDHFMQRAWDKQIDKMISDLMQDVKDTTKRLGM